MKRLACLILTIVMAVMIIPMSLTNNIVEAKGTVIKSGECGPKLKYEITDDGVLTISGSGPMYDYDNGDTPWFEYTSDVDWVEGTGFVITPPKKQIQAIIVTDGVKSIGSNAFYWLTTVKSVTLPDSIESMGDYAFYYLQELTSIKLPSALTSIGESAFEYCKKLKSLVIPEGVKEIGDCAIKQCDALASIVIPGTVEPDRFGVYAISWCRALKNVVIKPGLTELPQGLFYSCYALTEASVPEGVTVIRNDAFEDCRSLKQIAIPGTVQTIEHTAFSGCTSLAGIDYGGSQSNWNKISIAEENDPLYSAKVYYNTHNQFIDVFVGSWFNTPVMWAYTSGVTAGTTPITFEPNKTCTRAEFVTFLYKFMGKPWKASWASECNFSDVKSSDWYYRAVVWANHEGITHGTSKTTFSPNTTLDRGMVISFLYNMEKSQHGAPKITLTGTKFTDVAKISYYYTPVLWAEQYRIANGTSATTFSPSKKCTRAEAVAFLYNIDKYWK